MLEPEPTRAGEAHPGEPELERFLRGELTRTEVRAIVRHLLTCCPRCREVTRRLRTLAAQRQRDLEALRERAGNRGPRPISNWRDRRMTEEEAQAELRRIVEQLEGIRARLLWISEGMPLPAQETAMFLGDEEMDVPAEVRSVIECVLADSIQPAMRDLQAAASYSPKGPHHSGPPLPRGRGGGKEEGP